MPQLPNQRPTDQKEATIPNQRPLALKEPPQRQLVDNTDNANLPPIASQPINDNPIPRSPFLQKILLGQSLRDQR